MKKHLSVGSLLAVMVSVLLLTSSVHAYDPKDSGGANTSQENWGELIRSYEFNSEQDLNDWDLFSDTETYIDSVGYLRLLSFNCSGPAPDYCSVSCAGIMSKFACNNVVISIKVMGLWYVYFRDNGIEFVVSDKNNNFKRKEPVPEGNGFVETAYFAFPARSCWYIPDIRDYSTKENFFAEYVEDDFDYRYWHQLTIVVTGSTYEFYFDGKKLTKWDAPEGLRTFGKIGIFAYKHMDEYKLNDDPLLYGNVLIDYIRIYRNGDSEYRLEDNPTFANDYIKPVNDPKRVAPPIADR
jgi:hypothetical protein